MNHKIRVDVKFFEDILAGNSKFVICLDNTDYHVGDTLVLDEYDHFEYTGRSYFPAKPIQSIIREVSGIESGYCILVW